MIKEKEKVLSAYLDIFLNFIYPRNIYCILCDDGIETTEKYSLCEACRRKAPFITSRECEKCGKPLENLYLPTKCPDCTTGNHTFTKAYSCVEYDEQMKQLVYKLKYGRQRYAAYHMAEIMIEKLKKQGVEDIDIIVPVPLHKNKLRKRGFNQAELLAKYIGKSMEWATDCRNLVRTRDTSSQNELNKDERKENVRNAFQVVSNEVFGGKKILLVDDIYTTGSTIDACCIELLKSKPKAILVITFATGRNN